MPFVPWKYAKSWNCRACGLCCRNCEVVLNTSEWVKITKKYGFGVTAMGIGKFFLGKKNNGICLFLSNILDKSLCSLQDSKPQACKLWPFKILSQPKYGAPNESFYTYKDKILFIYVNSTCKGITWGKPSKKFMHQIIPEFIGIALGINRKQFYSTSKIYYTQNNSAYRKKII